MTNSASIRMHAGVCLLLGLLVAAVPSPPAVQAAPAADPDRIVVMISVDGLAAFYMDDPRAEMPTIRALADGGARAGMKASAPTVTWPNHTTLVTGVKPARHGVVGNNYFDRKSGKPVTLICDPEFDKDQIVKVPTIYDLAKAAGFKTAAIRWPASRNAKSLDWTFPDVASDELLHKCTTPALLAECQQAGIWSDGEAVDPRRPQVRIVSDEMCARVFNLILRTHRPNLALLHVINVDHIQHVDGPRSPEAYAAIKAADEQVREIWEALKRDYSGKATLVIVSDHGFSPIDQLVLPNVTLHKAGLVELEGNRAAGGPVRTVVQGGAAMLYVLDDARKAEIVERVTKAFDGAEGIGAVVGPAQLKDHGVADPQADPHAPDMLLLAKEGYGFADTATGDASVVERRDLKGGHGHDENLPNLHATFIAWGRGVKPGTRLGEIQNTDVAPTVARLMGLTMPAVDGKVLSAALAD